MEVEQSKDSTVESGDVQAGEDHTKRNKVDDKEQKQDKTEEKDRRVKKDSKSEDR